MASEQRGGVCANQFERLKKRKDFVAAASGRRFHTERMTVQGRLRDEEAGEDRAAGVEAGLRIGLTVTKRVGHAVERNRIKRRLREATKAAICTAATGAPAEGEPGPATTCDDAAGQIRADIVVIARRPALTAKFDDLVADFARALPKVTKPGRPTGGAGASAKQAGDAHPRRGRANRASHSS